MYYMIYMKCISGRFTVNRLRIKLSGIDINCYLQKYQLAEFTLHLVRRKLFHLNFIFWLLIVNEKR